MRLVLAAMVVVLVACSPVWADCGCGTPVVVNYGAAGVVPVATDLVTYRPLAPVVTYRPLAPVVTYRPLAPAPVVTYRPLVAAPVVVYRPLAPAPVVTYRPLAPAPVVVYRPAPVVTYRPLAPAPVVAYPPAYYGAPVVRTKVYYPGEPVRNFFKAITP